MLTPIGDKTLEFVLKSLVVSTNAEHQYKILELLKRTSLLYCDQAEKIIEKLNLKDEQGKFLKVIIFVQIYENIIDKENYLNKIKPKLENEKELNQFEILTAKYKEMNDNNDVNKNNKIPSEVKNFQRKDFDDNPNIYIDKFAKVKSNYASNSNINENKRKNLIPLEEFYEFLNEAKDCFEDKNKFCEKLKKKFEIVYISSNNAMDILNNKTKKLNDDFRFDLILEVYPYLIDPQNIERLINNLVDSEMEYKLREKLVNFSNYYFELKGENVERGACCCIIF